MAQARSDTQKDLYSIQTWVANSISLDDNCYVYSASSNCEKPAGSKPMKMWCKYIITPQAPGKNPGPYHFKLMEQVLLIGTAHEAGAFKFSFPSAG